jgi:hypothetical protein
VSSHTSSTPITIDDGTGTVMVELNDLDVDEPVLALDRLVDDGDSLVEDLVESFVRGDDSEGLRQREHVIPVGQRVFAIGQVASGMDGLRLTKPAERGQPFLVSTRDEAQLAAAAARSAQWLTIGAAAAVVVGVGLAVAGLVL